MNSLRIVNSLRTRKTSAGIQSLLVIATLAISSVVLIAKPMFDGADAASSSLVSASVSPPFIDPAVAYDMGRLSPGSIDVADINSDHYADLVVASCQPLTNTCGNGGAAAEGVIAIFFGNGSGKFGVPTRYDSGASNANSVKVADVNQDGKADLLVAACGRSGSTVCGEPAGGVVTVLLGNGDGTFQTPLVFGSGGISASSIAVGDVNGDGNLDMAVANSFDTYSNAKSGLVGILLGNGDGSFSQVVGYSSGQVGATSVAIADLNNDHKLDVVVGNGDCPNTADAMCVGILTGNGDGSFKPVVTFHSGGGEVTSVAVADVNVDGKPDVLVSNWCVFCANTVGVLLGNGDGTFQSPVTYASGGSGAWSVAAQDLNGDNKPDVVVANQCTGATKCSSPKGLIGLLLNNGDGTFQPVIPYPAAGKISSFITLADLNNDSRPDIVVANQAYPTDFHGSVSVLMNNMVDTTPPFITIAAAPKTLWPANWQMMPVHISGTIVGLGSPVDASSAEYVVSDEYDRVEPSGHLSLDANGKYSVTIFLQASRRTNDLDGRRYLIRISAKDTVGNKAVKWARVIVPHQL